MITDGAFPLGDGLTARFCIWGDPAGAPVIHLHGSPGSRLERSPDEAGLARLGVRLISFDRPGYGHTPAAGGGSLRRCVQMVAALADHLALETFRLQTFSAGGPYGLAAAHDLGDRVRGVAVLGSIGPLDRPGAFDAMSADALEEYLIARDEPGRLGAFLSQRKTAPGLPLTEYDAIEAVPGLLDVLLKSHPESQRQGQAGVMNDDFALVAPWGFDLGKVRAPVRLWHGEADQVVPMHHSEFLASSLPSAKLHRCPGAGHFAIFGRQDQVLSDLLVSSAV